MGKVELKMNSEAWAHIFRTSREIRDGLQLYGDMLARNYGTGRAYVKAIKYTQVAVIDVPSAPKEEK